MRNAHATHVDFGFLRGIISSNPNFMPSNIDMVLERKGRFLFGEWKREDELMNTGQRILLNQLSWKHRVLLITGYVDEKPHIDLIQKFNPNGTLTLVGHGLDDLVNYIRGWYEEVENNVI